MKVLIVDDSALSRKLILQDVERLDHIEILQASSGEEAAQIALEKEPDLITMDIEMDGMDGISTARKIRRYPQCSHIPIVMISSKTDDVIKQLAFSAGANIFFEKPFKQGKLFDYIKELMVKDETFLGLTALVVDDSSLMRTLIASPIKAKGANIIEADDAITALDMIEKQHIDLIITDLVMPGMDGIDLISYVRNELKNYEIPIILLTAVADQNVQIEALRIGADDFLIKPFSREELLSRIGNHYRRIKVSRAFNEQIYNMQKMEQVGLLLSGVMHDTNNALGNIGNLAFLAQLNLDNNNNATSELSSIQSEVERGGELIKELLSFARNEDANFDQLGCFQLSTVIDEVIKLFTLSKLMNIKLYSNSIGEHIFIEGSKAKIAQVLLNLLNNAKHALQKSQRPEIKINTSTIKTGTTVQVRNKAISIQQNMVHIEVNDSGCGISPKHINTIFEPFYTTKSKGEGTGLGLAMIKRTIISHHGLIHVESKLNIGSTFHIYLPLKTL